MERIELMSAFKNAVTNYKPWHSPSWNHSGKDALWQLVDVADRLGFISPQLAQEKFSINPTDYHRIKQGKLIPDKKLRKKIWTHFKSCL